MDIAAGSLYFNLNTPDVIGVFLREFTDWTHILLFGNTKVNFAQY